MTSANEYKCSVCGGVLELSLEAAQAHTDAVDAAGGKPVSIASYFACSKCGRPITGMTGMTAPHERTRALIETKSFLLKLVDTTRLPRVPKSVREHAAYLLQHYPAYADIEDAHKALPDLYASVHPPRLLEDPLQPDVGDKQ